MHSPAPTALTMLDQITRRLSANFTLLGSERIARYAPATCDGCHRFSAFPAQSQLKDERKVRPKIHMLLSLVAVKFNFEKGCCPHSG
jgi:hypothetical protein